MIDISKFVTIGEDGKPVIDAKSYESAYDAELRKALDTNSEKTKKSLEAEIKKQLEEEAKLSAEEKLKKERELFEAEKAQHFRDFAKEQAKVKMKGAELEEDEINTYLELVNSNDDIAKIDKILEMRTKRTETLKKEFESSILNNQPNPQGDGNGEGEKSYGAQMAERYQNRSQDLSNSKITAWGTEN